jgi:uncharacterized protein with FMN-binding domain
MNMLKQRIARFPFLPFLFLSFVVMGVALARKANPTEQFVSPYHDGVFKGSGPGFAGDIIVAVEIKKGKIESVKILTQNEDYPRDAIRVIPHRIVKAQGVEGVEAVVSATVTSNGIIEAVKKALESAQNPAAKADTASTKNKQLE